MDHPLLVCMPSYRRSTLGTTLYPTFELQRFKTISFSLDSKRANVDGNIDNMSKVESNMSESGWTMYLDDSSWTWNDDISQSEREHIVCKESSEITENVEGIESSMASDASSSPILQQGSLTHHKLDQSSYPLSYPTRIRGMQEDVECEAFCSTTNKKCRKRRQIRKVESTEAELLQDTASSSLQSSKNGLVEGETLEQIPAESLHDTKIRMEEIVGFEYENKSKECRSISTLGR